MARAVAHTVEFTLIGDHFPSRSFPAVLRYDSADAFAVRAVFPMSETLDGTDLVWVFARELLSAGLGNPSGAGDVRIAPLGSQHCQVELYAPQGSVLLTARSADLRAFLAASHALTPPGEEEVPFDWHALLANPGTPRTATWPTEPGARADPSAVPGSRVEEQ